MVLNVGEEGYLVPNVGEEGVVVQRLLGGMSCSP